MEDIQLQLAALRQRIARVDRKYANVPPPPRPPLRPDCKIIEELMSGEVVTTEHGMHFETERLWERHRRHGSVYIADLADLPHDLLQLFTGEVAAFCVGRNRRSTEAATAPGLRRQRRRRQPAPRLGLRQLVIRYRRSLLERVVGDEGALERLPHGG